MLNPEWKAKWLAALRSGKYQQGQHELVRQTESGPLYCCIGVLCNLTGTSLDDKFDNETEDPTKDRDRPLGNWYEAGLSQNECDTLADMNDHGSSFEEIADYIEKNL